MKSAAERVAEPPQPLARNPKNTAMRSANRFIEDKIRKKSRRNVTICEKYTIFALRNATGCSSARLEYASGGRVVAGSNPVTPTDEKSLIFNRISRIFLLWYIVRKMAVVHKWYINGRYSKNFNLSR